MRTLQESMGHRDLTTTQIYADYPPNAAESEMVAKGVRSLRTAPGAAKTRPRETPGWRLIGNHGRATNRGGTGSWASCAGVTRWFEQGGLPLRDPAGWSDLGPGNSNGARDGCQMGH